MQPRDEDFDNVNPGEARPLIKEGPWPAEYVRYESRPSRWGDKLYVYWRVFTSPSKTKSVFLPRYYNLDRDGGGRFKFGHLHDYRKDWTASHHGQVPPDSTNLSPSIWRKATFLVEVVTVCNGSDGPLPPSLYWSRIGRIIRPLHDGESLWRLIPQSLDFAE